MGGVCSGVQTTWRLWEPSDVGEGDPASDGECPVYRFELYRSCHLVMRIPDSLSAPAGTQGPSGKMGIDFLGIEFSANPRLTPLTKQELCPEAFYS